MRNVIKKISTIIMILILISSIFILSDYHDVFADEVDYTVNFHYTRDDSNYAGYTITAWAPSDSSGQKGEFAVSGNEGVFTYSFKRDTDIDEYVSFIIQIAGSSAVSFEQTKAQLKDGVNSMDVYINVTADNQSWGYEATQSPSGEFTETTPEETLPTETTSASIETSTVDTNVTPSTQAATEIESDDPNKDYSVGTVKAVVIDVLLFAILGVSSYMILGKEKKTKI